MGTVCLVFLIPEYPKFFIPLGVRDIRGVYDFSVTPGFQNRRVFREVWYSARIRTRKTRIREPLFSERENENADEIVHGERAFERFRQQRNGSVINCDRVSDASRSSPANDSFLRPRDHAESCQIGVVTKENNRHCRSTRVHFRTSCCSFFNYSLRNGRALSTAADALR